jgi:hypothetical protein
VALLANLGSKRLTIRLRAKRKLKHAEKKEGEKTMAIKKQSADKGKIKVGKLKVKKDKVEEVTDKQARRVKGGAEPRNRNAINFQK